MAGGSDEGREGKLARPDPAQESAPDEPGREGSDGHGGAERGQEPAQGQAGDVHGPPLGAGGLELPKQSPLFHAQQADRYDRQAWIREYERRFDCRLIVVIDDIFPDGITLLEDLIFDATPEQDLHLLLDSPGGDGETAIRMLQSMQARCRELTVIVVDRAKSAATLIALGAHHVLMGPTSDLGPIDPQFRVPRGDGSWDLAAGKDIVAAVDAALADVSDRPDTYPVHAALLADVTALMVQAARSAIGRTSDLLREALAANPDRDENGVERLIGTLTHPLIENPRAHGAVFGVRDAREAGLPLVPCDPRSWQWQVLWRLYTKYSAIPSFAIYEGGYASQIMRIH